MSVLHMNVRVVAVEETSLVSFCELTSQIEFGKIMRGVLTLTTEQ
jgi:hypothetical protein